MSPRDAMRAALRRTYLRLLVPAAVLLAVLEALKSLEWFDGFRPPGRSALEVVVLVAAAMSALGFPILYRSLFAHTHRDRRQVPLEMFYRFENNSVFISLLAPYCAVAASLFSFGAFFAAATTLLALYAAYYFYPSRRRIDGDARVFRVSA